MRRRTTLAAMAVCAAALAAGPALAEGANENAKEIVAEAAAEAVEAATEGLESVGEMETETEDVVQYGIVERSELIEVKDGTYHTPKFAVALDEAFVGKTEPLYYENPQSGYVTLEFMDATTGTYVGSLDAVRADELPSFAWQGVCPGRVENGETGEKAWLIGFVTGKDVLEANLGDDSKGAVALSQALEMAFDAPEGVDGWEFVPLTEEEKKELEEARAEAVAENGTAGETTEAVTEGAEAATEGATEGAEG